MISKKESDGNIAFINEHKSDKGSVAHCLDVTGGRKFDLVIDDASHIPSLSKASFDWLFPQALSRSGWYFLEIFGSGCISGFPGGAQLKHTPQTGDRKEYPAVWNGGMAEELDRQESSRIPSAWGIS